MSDVLVQSEHLAQSSIPLSVPSFPSCTLPSRVEKLFFGQGVPKIQSLPCNFRMAETSVMARTCFISPIPCPMINPSRRPVPRRPRTITLAKKGFRKPAQPPESKKARKASPTRRTPDPSKPFVPKGPTLRKEYEEKGIIEPSFSPDAGVLPEIVANRMLRRILSFAGVPLIFLFAFFAAYFILKYKYDITVLPAVVAYSTLGTITMSGIGITYGIFSSSWDEDIEGSWLGWEEASTNLLRAKDGLFGAREREKRKDEFDRLDRLQEGQRKKEESDGDSESED